MPAYSQLPGSMGLRFKSGDTFSTVVDFDISLSNHTVSSSLTSLVHGGEVSPITTSFVDQAAGKVSISLTHSQTAAIPPASYGWEMSWVAPGGVKRTALSGVVEVTP